MSQQLKNECAFENHSQINFRGGGDFEVTPDHAFSGAPERTLKKRNLKVRLKAIALALSGGIAGLCSSALHAGDVILNTGYDHSAGTVYASGTDEYWIKISSYEPPAPSAPVAEANVVVLGGSFAPPAPQSTWLAHNSAASSGGAGGLFTGYHIYRKCFCIIDDVAEHRIKFGVRADDRVQVWMNNTTQVLVPWQYGKFWQTDPLPISVDVSGEGILRPGKNCIYVMVEDFGGVAAFNLEGTVSGALTTPAKGPNMEFGPCCDEVNGSASPRAESAIPGLNPQEREAVLDSIKAARIRAAPNVDAVPIKRQ